MKKLLNKETKQTKKKTIKATLVYVWDLWEHKVFIDGTEENAKELSYIIKRGVQAIAMLNEEEKSE